MDIIDVMLARALTPQGRIESYAAQSQQAVAQANQAIAAIDSITEQTQANNEAAQTAMENAQTAMENAEAAEQRVDAALESIQAASETQIENKIDELAFSLTSNANASAIVTDMVVSTPSGLAKTVNNINKMYRTTGQNEDGTMTQKAITDALAQKANSSDTVTKTYVDQKIANISYTGGGSSISNLGIDDAGHIVVIGSDGIIQAGDATEAAIIEALIKSGTYTAEGTVGLTIDYENKSYERTQDAANLTMGTQFNKYTMYGGRIRCNVADDGTINAFYGDANYIEDGSNGQVMVYQPKFYYQRTYIKNNTGTRGMRIQKESLILSPTKKTGFKLHPLFKNGDEELDYVLLPAYEGSIYDTSTSSYLKNNEAGVTITEDKLSSIAGAKPFNGIKNTLTISAASRLATNRGAGWQLTNAEFESASQMLEMIEFGSPNGQVALDKGITNISRDNAKDCSGITGATSSLGNTTGIAESTSIDRDGNRTTYTTSGSNAISYRGIENPWGNLWRLVANLTARGGGNNGGGVVYINDTPLNISLPFSSNSWISAFGCIDAPYEWLYIPIECSSTANSAVPIGDSLWSSNGLNGRNLFAIGGLMNSGEGAGLFHYSADIELTANLQNFNGRIMFIPEKNETYNANIIKWQQHYGG